MDNNFKDISIRGRVAYCISCFENVLLYYGCDKEKWKFVLEQLWSFMNVEYVDDWFYQTAEILPECILEDKYDEDPYEFIDKRMFYELYQLYDSSCEVIKKIIRLIFELGSRELYGRIQGYSESTIEILEKVIQLCKKESIQLPDIADYKKYSFSVKNGWGEKFEGRKLSKILNNI